MELNSRETLLERREAGVLRGTRPVCPRHFLQP